MHAILEGVPIQVFALLACLPFLGRTVRASLVTMGLFTSSAMLVHLSGGQIEMHFHFFAILGIIALYQDWSPFLLGIGYVLVHHGVMGTLAPSSIYNHQAAIDQPWLWAGIHAGFVIFASVGLIFTWREADQSRAEALGRAQRLERAERRYRSLVQNASDVVAVIDASGVITYISPSVQALAGYAPEDLLGTKGLELMHPDDRPTDQPSLVPEAGQSRRRSFRWRHRDGSWIEVETTITNLLNDPAIGGLVLNARDVSDSKRLEEQLRQQAFYDGLTGLPNRVLFEDRLAHALAREAVGESVAVVFVDLDHFKLVNDSLGHGAGDGVLVCAADRFRCAVRAQDTTARFGGDEFAFLLEPLSSVGEAVATTERIIAAMRPPIRLHDQKLVVGASAGIAIGRKGDSAEDLLRQADTAMYVAKSRGRGGHCLFDETMTAGRKRQLDLRTALLDALANDDLSVAYQPLVDLATGNVLGVEALARWHHPTRGAITPAEFIPIAEESEAIIQLGQFVFREVAQLANRWWATYGTRLNFSVNASERELRQPNYADSLLEQALVWDLCPEQVTVEITENVALQSSPAILHSVELIKTNGMRIAIDDFGAGYTPLAHLGVLKADCLKIDRSFVANLPDDEQSVSVVRALLALARGFEMTVIAEGVETLEQATLLQELGCANGQGYFFARPMPADELFRPALAA
ncbi:MAG: EAL domain-containing protein [Dehalococcoidia bacterium]